MRTGLTHFDGEFVRVARVGAGGPHPPSQGPPAQRPQEKAGGPERNGEQEGRRRRQQAARVRDADDAQAGRRVP